MQIEESVVADSPSRPQRPGDVGLQLTQHIRHDLVDLDVGAENGAGQVVQPQERSGGFERVAVRPHDAYVGEGRQQRLDVHRMRRHLQRPRSWRAGLQHLQHRALVGIGAGHVGPEEPVRIGAGRHERLPQKGLEILTLHEHALGRAVGLVPVHHRDVGRLEPHGKDVELGLLLQAAWIGTKRSGDEGGTESSASHVSSDRRCGSWSRR